MIEFVDGDLFDSGADVLVNPVNCIGVSGAGLALQFKKRFPESHRRYRATCKYGMMQLGEIFVDADREIPIIVYFPTKNHWLDKSRLEWIDLGLQDTADKVGASLAQSLAVPMLGCGLGGLDWQDVRPLIIQHLAPLNCRVMVYGPSSDR